MFFDFGEEHPLWWIYPESNETYAYIQSITRDQLIQSLQEQSVGSQNGFDALIHDFDSFIKRCESDPELPRLQRLKDIQKG